MDQPVTLDELLKAREDLIAQIVGKMPEQHKRFLISVKRGQPDWAALRSARRKGFAGSAVEAGEPSEAECRKAGATVEEAQCCAPNQGVVRRKVCSKNCQAGNGCFIGILLVEMTMVAGVELESIWASYVRQCDSSGFPACSRLLRSIVH